MICMHGSFEPVEAEYDLDGSFELVEAEYDLDGSFEPGEAEYDLDGSFELVEAENDLDGSFELVEAEYMFFYGKVCFSFIIDIATRYAPYVNEMNAICALSKDDLLNTFLYTVFLI